MSGGLEAAIHSQAESRSASGRLPSSQTATELTGNFRRTDRIDTHQFGGQESEPEHSAKARQRVGATDSKPRLGTHSRLPEAAMNFGRCLQACRNWFQGPVLGQIVPDVVFVLPTHMTELPDLPDREGARVQPRDPPTGVASDLGDSFPSAVMPGGILFLIRTTHTGCGCFWVNDRPSVSHRFASVPRPSLVWDR